MQKRKNKESDYIKYLEAIAKFKDISTKYTQKFMNDHLLIFCLSSDKDSIIITVTDGMFNCWVTDLDFNRIQKMREDFGIQGTYESFFEYVNKALKTNKIKLTRKDEHKLIIALNFNISEQVSIKSIIEVKENYNKQKKPDKFSMILQQTLFTGESINKQNIKELEAENAKLKAKLLNKEAFIKDNYIVEQNKIPGLDFGKNGILARRNEQKIKRNYRKNLVNPNQRKKKKRGFNFKPQ